MLQKSPRYYVSSILDRKQSTLHAQKTMHFSEFYEQKYFEKVYLKLNLAQSTKQERGHLNLPT